MLALSLGKVYTFGPTFRAENSNTSRHIAEFWMLEPEMAFADLWDNMQLSEDLLVYITENIINNCREDIELFQNFVNKKLFETLETLKGGKFEKITYEDAVQLLKKANKEFNFKPEYGNDLQTEHERFLAEDYFKKPVFVYNYPKTIKPFYMRLNDDNKTVAAMDLLVPGIGELIGGSQREERLDYLKKRMIESEIDPSEYWWYLDSRKYGSVPHSGFGLGFERLLMLLTGISNIRDVIPFPRTPGSIEF
jgi:asparaginyl-tRNA synthetase